MTNRKIDYLMFLNRKKHTDQLKNLMIEIISVILAEYETVPFTLLELLFARIIDPEKVCRFDRFIQSIFSFILEITWRMLWTRRIDHSSWWIFFKKCYRWCKYQPPSSSTLHSIILFSSISKQFWLLKIRTLCNYIRKFIIFSMNYVIYQNPLLMNSFRPLNID